MRHPDPLAPYRERARWWYVGDCPHCGGLVPMLDDPENKHFKLSVLPGTFAVIVAPCPHCGMKAEVSPDLLRHLDLWH